MHSSDEIAQGMLRENASLRRLAAAIATVGVVLWTAGTVLALAGGSGALAVSIAGGLVTGTGLVMAVGAWVERRGIVRRAASARDRGYGLHW